MQFACEGLADEWDGIDTIRGRLRRGQKLLVGGKISKDGTIKECVQNADVLPIALTRLNACLKLPEIDALRDEVEELYKKASREIAMADVEEDAWGVRTLLKFIKRKAKREEVSLESCF